jgi:hypothetical protein
VRELIVLRRLLPNYCKPAAEVYRDVIGYVIETSNDLKVLSMVQRSKHLAEESIILPTWVPHLDQPYQGFHLHKNFHRSSKDLPLSAISQSERDALVLRGIQFDLIKDDGSQSFTEAMDLCTGLKMDLLVVVAIMFQNAWSLTGSRAHAYTEGKERLWAFYMTVSGGSTVHRTSAESDSDHWASIWAYESQLAGAAEANDSEPSTRMQFWGEEKKRNREGGDAKAFGQLMAGTYRFRQIFMTKKGYIGLGPDAMRPGDVVCLIFGGRVPYVLRNMGSYWEFIGECYVHGIMNGEALESLDGDISNAEIFELR